MSSDIQGGSTDIPRLSDWLQWSRRPANSFDGFTVVDYSELGPPNGRMKNFLARLLVEARFDPDFLVAAAAELDGIL